MSVLQCVAVCCGVLQCAHVNTRDSIEVRKCVTVCCGVLQCVHVNTRDWILTQAHPLQLVMTRTATRALNSAMQRGVMTRAAMQRVRLIERNTIHICNTVIISVHNRVTIYHKEPQHYTYS